jgi:periplasmic copper chaperone A
MRNRAITTTVALASAALLALSGCTSATSAETATPVPQGKAISIADAWVKAADSGMSAAFGTLENDSAAPVTVVSVDSTASTSMQLHETVANETASMVMREKRGGFTIPARGKLELAPGGNHLMLMDLTGPIAAGEDVAFTLTMKDGSTYRFTAPAKDYTGADETYQGGDMGGMDMGTDSPAPTDGSTGTGH